jgi:hypothetical protein
LSGNPSYLAGNQQNHPLSTAIPTYETINDIMGGIKLDLIETKAEGPVADVREDAYHKLNRTQRDDKRGRMRIKYMCIDLGKYKDPKGRRGELLDPAVELVYWRFSTAMLTLAPSAFSPTQLHPMRRRDQQVSAKDL